MFSFPSHQFHQLSVTYITDIPNFLPDEVGEVMRSVCWGQTVDSGATGASNLVMQPLGPRGRFLKNERQDSENLNKTDTRNMENLLGKFYVLIKCCICKRSVYAASGLNTALHTEPVYSCVGYSSLHCIELWPLSCRGWSADFLIWCSQHLIALRAQLCSSATNASFKKSLQETLSIFLRCSASVDPCLYGV